MLKSARIALLLIIPAIGFAQSVPRSPIRFAGTFVSVAGDAVTLKDKEGKTFVVQMTPGWTVSSERKAGVDALKAGQFIASQNVPVNANAGKSTEVRILEAGYRPEFGTHVMSATNSNMMTHGTVKSVSKTASGVELEVTYPEGSRRLAVAAEAPVTVSDLLNHNVLKPGTLVGSVTRPDAKGVERASRLQLLKE